MPCYLNLHRYPFSYGHMPGGPLTSTNDKKRPFAEAFAETIADGVGAQELVFTTLAKEKCAVTMSDWINLSCPMLWYLKIIAASTLTLGG